MKLKLLLLTLALTLSGQSIFSQSIESKFQIILDSFYNANPASVGILVHVEAPSHNISWSAAAGYNNKDTKEKAKANQPALVASNTKTYVSVAILRLVEKGLLKLDDSIYKHLNKKTCKQFKKAGYATKEITIRHLLSHSSGIADYVDDKYFKFVSENPKYHWTRNQQIKLACEVGKPLAKPGEQFNYADINFLLLTEIIERKTKQTFYKAIHDLIDYKTHQLNDTWFETLETKPTATAPLLYQYTEKLEQNSYGIDPSWDLYGGGGVACTVEDLASFFQLLFEGKIIKDGIVLKEIYTNVPTKEKSSYCLGLQKIPFDGMEAYYHGGFWGTDVIYIPELNVTIAAFTLQKEHRMNNANISKEILKILKKKL